MLLDVSTVPEAAGNAAADAVGEAANNVANAATGGGTDVWSVILQNVIQYGLRFLIALAVLIVGFVVVNAIFKKLKKRGFKKMDPTAGAFVLSCLNVILKVLIVVTAVGIMGIPLASITGVLVACGAAIGLALQGSLSNFAGGIMLLVFRPFRVGDYVETQGVQGTVKSISIFYTALTTVDNREVTLPNGSLMNTSITNYTANDQRRVDLVFSVSYDADLDRVKEILRSIAEAHPLALKDPAPAVMVSAHGKSGVDVTFRVWCKTEDYWTVRFEVIETVKKAFDRTGIKIPYEQLDVHLKNED